MAHYRIYFCITNGHISDPPEEAECVDDQVAIERAIPLLNGRAIEVWEGPPPNDQQDTKPAQR